MKTIYAGFHFVCRAWSCCQTLFGVVTGAYHKHPQQCLACQLVLRHSDLTLRLHGSCASLHAADQPVALLLHLIS